MSWARSITETKRPMATCRVADVTGRIDFSSRSVSERCARAVMRCASSRPARTGGTPTARAATPGYRTRHRRKRQTAGVVTRPSTTRRERGIRAARSVTSLTPGRNRRRVGAVTRASTRRLLAGIRPVRIATSRTAALPTSPVASATRRKRAAPTGARSRPVRAVIARTVRKARCWRRALPVTRKLRFLDSTASQSTVAAQGATPGTGTLFRRGANRAPVATAIACSIFPMGRALAAICSGAVSPRRWVYSTASVTSPST